MENLLDVGIYIQRKLHFCTDKQVQKITYYAYCWYIVKNNKDAQNITNRLFEQHPEAWIHGPVFHDLYDEMTYYRKRFLERQEKLSEETKGFLDKIIGIYGKYTGNQLEDLTHNETPWREARCGLPPACRSREQLKDSVIFEYYHN